MDTEGAISVVTALVEGSLFSSEDIISTITGNKILVGRLVEIVFISFASNINLAIS